MSKVNPQTIVSDRLTNMHQTTKGLRRQKGNLYSHLCQLLSYLSLESDAKNRKIDSIKELSSISEYIKKCSDRQNQAQPFSEDKLNDVVSKKIQHPEWLTKKRQLLTFMQNKKQDVKKEEIIVQNFQKIHKILFSNGGISLGDEQALRINIALQKLKHKTQAQKIRFWGKIFTKSSDYYIIQGVAHKKFTQSPIQSDMQKYKQGVNYYSYWVNSSSMESQWHELPLITPQQMRTSKLIKYTFSGNLNVEIRSYPKFQGKQQHFLKAQLVRITHNCEVTPKGMYGPTEENLDEIQFAQDFKMPEFAQQSNLQNWVHINPHILDLGRGSHWVDPKLSQEQKQQIMNRLIETDPKMERLKGINEDKPVQGKGVQTSWFTKMVGSSQVYNNVGKDQGTTSCYGIMTLKNVNWPGWITCSNMNYFDSIYLGYGIKATQPAFFPIGPENLMVQGQDLEEISQPNPTNPPDELEPDSDEENKKPEQ